MEYSFFKGTDQSYPAVVTIAGVGYRYTGEARSSFTALVRPGIVELSFCPLSSYLFRESLCPRCLSALPRTCKFHVGLLARGPV